MPLLLMYVLLQRTRVYCWPYECWLIVYMPTGLDSSFLRRWSEIKWIRRLSLRSENERSEWPLSHPCFQHWYSATKQGPTLRVPKRYSEFVRLRNDLIKTFPKFVIPNLPHKSSLAKFRPSFLERRRKHLSWWLTSILMHCEMGGSGVVRAWILEWILCASLVACCSVLCLIEWEQRVNSSQYLP